ncbi:unnamed protein product [Amoebophrya sp. A25]|nr:unnamed protein product [Amoebophrya sp. A25]|eukprot:GSA25T00010531001.1
MAEGYDNDLPPVVEAGMMLPESSPLAPLTKAALVNLESRNVESRDVVPGLPSLPSEGDLLKEISAATTLSTKAETCVDVFDDEEEEDFNDRDGQDFFNDDGDDSEGFFRRGSKESSVGFFRRDSKESILAGESFLRSKEHEEPVVTDRFEDNVEDEHYENNHVDDIGVHNDEELHQRKIEVQEKLFSLKTGRGEEADPTSAAVHLQLEVVDRDLKATTSEGGERAEREYLAGEEIFCEEALLGNLAPEDYHLPRALRAQIVTALSPKDRVYVIAMAVRWIQENARRVEKSKNLAGGGLQTHQMDPEFGEQHYNFQDEKSAFLGGNGGPKSGCGRDGSTNCGKREEIEDGNAPARYGGQKHQLPTLLGTEGLPCLSNEEGSLSATCASSVADLAALQHAPPPNASVAKPVEGTQSKQARLSEKTVATNKEALAPEEASYDCDNMDPSSGGGDRDTLPVSSAGKQSSARSASVSARTSKSLCEGGSVAASRSSKCSSALNEARRVPASPGGAQAANQMSQSCSLGVSGSMEHLEGFLRSAKTFVNEIRTHTNSVGSHTNSSSSKSTKVKQTGLTDLLTRSAYCDTGYPIDQAFWESSGDEAGDAKRARVSAATAGSVPLSSAPLPVPVCEGNEEVLLSTFLSTLDGIASKRGSAAEQHLLISTSKGLGGLQSRRGSVEGRNVALQSPPAESGTGTITSSEQGGCEANPSNAAEYDVDGNLLQEVEHQSAELSLVCAASLLMPEAPNFRDENLDGFIGLDGLDEKDQICLNALQQQQEPALLGSTSSDPFSAEGAATWERSTGEPCAQLQSRVFRCPCSLCCVALTQSGVGGESEDFGMLASGKELNQGEDVLEAVLQRDMQMNNMKMVGEDEVEAASRRASAGSMFARKAKNTDSSRSTVASSDPVAANKIAWVSHNSFLRAGLFSEGLQQLSGDFLLDVVASMFLANSFALETEESFCDRFLPVDDEVEEAARNDHNGFQETGEGEDGSWNIPPLEGVEVEVLNDGGDFIPETGQNGNDKGVEQNHNTAAKGDVIPHYEVSGTLMGALKKEDSSQSQISITISTATSRQLHVLEGTATADGGTLQGVNIKIDDDCSRRNSKSGGGVGHDINGLGGSGQHDSMQCFYHRDGLSGHTLRYLSARAGRLLSTSHESEANTSLVLCEGRVAAVARRVIVKGELLLRPSP